MNIYEADGSITTNRQLIEEEFNSLTEAEVCTLLLNVLLNSSNLIDFVTYDNEVYIEYYSGPSSIGHVRLNSLYESYYETYTILYRSCYGID